MLVTIDNAGTKGFHGITILDRDGDAISRICFFDMESRQCWDKDGRVITTATHWGVPCRGEQAYLKAKHSLPEQYKKHAIRCPTNPDEEWPQFFDRMIKALG